MKYNKKRDNKKPLAVALGVILALAPGAVIVDNLEPVSVYADAGEFAGLTDFLSATNSADFSGWAVPGFPAYIAGLYTIALCLNNPIHGNIGTSDSLFAVTGKFIYNGEVYPVSTSMLVGEAFSSSDGGIMVINSPLFFVTYNIYSNDEKPLDPDITCTFSSGNSVQCRFRFDWGDTQRPITTSIVCSGLFDDYISTSKSYSAWRWVLYQPSIPTLNTSKPITAYLAGSNPSAIGGNFVRATFPSSSGSPVSLDYISDIYNPYYVSQYPELEPYIYAPYSPEFPDPSDAYPGIPKDWTIKNPQLPTSPSIGLNAYKPDLSEMNPSESISEFDTGFDFWWWITERSLTHINTKTIVLIAILCGLVGYLLWHLGGHL